MIGIWLPDQTLQGPYEALCTLQWHGRTVFSEQQRHEIRNGDMGHGDRVYLALVRRRGTTLGFEKLLVWSPTTSLGRRFEQENGTSIRHGDGLYIWIMMLLIFSLSQLFFF
ncbi:hypothetical protein HRI_002872200 [Hibiscus trionum]|uniref:Uncharacterized protein n=1 Tax=Hibiscus trionum TaxID=183268 RepID=A0A9W7M954_HIBTR|nr:hypothetical protein HRI_002872200 [Hibiscus trionum]